MPSCPSTPQRTAFTLLELLISMAIIAVLLAMLVAAVQKAREAAARCQCASNLRQLGLAIHQFHDVHKVFPPSGYTAAGPGNPAGKYVGWRCLILPHLDQAQMHSAYDFSKHWWEEPNLTTGAAPVPVFLCPSVPGRHAVTSAVARPPRPALTFASPPAAADYEAIMGVQPCVNPVLYASSPTNRSVLVRNSPIPMVQISDGASNTIMAVECGGRPLVYRGRTLRPDLSNDQGVAWLDSEGPFSLDGSNDDGVVQCQGPSVTPRAVNATNDNEPYSFHPGGAHMLFADGHVSFVHEAIALGTFAALVTRAAGESTAFH